MRRSLFVVVVGMLFGAGVSFAQEEAPQMPEKVRKALEWRIGTWEIAIAGENRKGTLINRWNPGKNCIVADVHGINDGKPFFATQIVGWDGVSKDGIHSMMVNQFQNWTGQGRITSDTTEEGPLSGFRFGKKYTGRHRLVKQDKDHITVYHTDQKLANESIPDMVVRFTRVKPTTREDFEEFCRVHQGRWVGEVKWATDWPGFGKKGDIVTGYRQVTISQDGNGLVIQGFRGKGSSTVIFSYDADGQIIRGMTISSGGSMAYITCRKGNGEWVWKGREVESDGTIIEIVGTSKFTENGRTWIQKGGGMRGKEEIEFADVWHKVSK